VLKKIIRITFSILGLVIGYILGEGLFEIFKGLQIEFLMRPFSRVLFLIFVILLFGIIFYFITPMVYKKITSAVEGIERNVQSFSAVELIFGTCGIIIALIIASLIGIPISRLHPVVGPIVFVLLDVIAAIIGAEIAIKKREDITLLLSNLKKNNPKEKKNKGNSRNTPKVLDTSVIIDGRIFDICKTEFVEGTLVIPSFVLDELRHISDSADSLKRNRGRRGLDILNRIQKELEIETQIWEGDFPEIAEVDAKLLKLAQTLNGKVITNDFNLNKVAEFQGVPVLNINELANAIKPVLLPGEEMKVIVIKDGKEATQGIAYLDDGTMIVVEGGRRYIGEEVYVIVTSVLQTAAGRMIFAKPKES
jgi:uncharacterized protein YacL